MNSTICISYATRRSALALAQSRELTEQLSAAHPEVTFAQHQVVTKGDRLVHRSLREIGGKGLFIKEIEARLLDGTCRFAVHSMKDVPSQLQEGLCIACVPKRLDCRDALLSRSGLSLALLDAASVIGTSSARRALMLARARSDVRIVELRGNVDTRINKMRSGEVDAIVLAYAGLLRLGREAEITELLAMDVSLPAVGQGALAVECRSDDMEMKRLLAPVHHPESAVAVAVERAIMHTAQGNCHVPIAAHAYRTVTGDLSVKAILASEDRQQVAMEQKVAVWPECEEKAWELGLQVGELLVQQIRL